MKCNICERGCFVENEKSGACGMYFNNNGYMKEYFPDTYLICCPISIETMPALNFYPGGKFLQISTIGCNFNCNGCISTSIAKDMKNGFKSLMKISPTEIVKTALDNNCIGIAFLMNDPLASFNTFYNVAKEAKGKGLLVGCSTNGYFTINALEKIAHYLDYVNIGIKGLTDATYRACGAGSFRPVLRNLKLFYEKGIHVEVACILKSDNTDETIALANKIATISRNIPLQVMRFIPLENANPKLEPSIKYCEQIVMELRKMLDYVYLFNSPGTELLNTVCPKCSKTLLKRDFYGPMGSKLKSFVDENISSCPFCGEKISIDGKVAKNYFKESDFQGGYPFTRALEMVEAIVIACGVKDRNSVLRCWEYIIEGNNLSNLHHDIQNPESYYETIRQLSGLAGVSINGEKLIKYLEEKTCTIKNKVSQIAIKPRVYYAMGKPLFAIKGDRLENQLVEFAGGISVNNELEIKGRPGMTIDKVALNRLNPDIMLISSFLSVNVNDFYDNCIEAGIEVEAVKNKRIYSHIAPNWDFGSPRWILGLMYIANILYPDKFNFDIEEEARYFYRNFYGIEYNKDDINRSFAKPSSTWEWK